MIAGCKYVGKFAVQILVLSDLFQIDKHRSTKTLCEQIGSFFCCSVAVRNSVDGQIASNFYAKYHRHRDRLRGDHDSSEPAHHDCRADGISGVVAARQEPGQCAGPYVSNHRPEHWETRAFACGANSERPDF